MSGRLLFRAGLFLLALLLAAGLLCLFLLRFRQGDSYPPYSTLRGDPLGGQVLYAALEELPGLELSRNLLPLSQLGEGRDATLFFLALSKKDLETTTDGEFQSLQQFVRSGGRLVLSLDGAGERPKKKKSDAAPYYSPPPPDPVPDANPSADLAQSDAPAPKTPVKKSEPPPFSILKAWGFGLRFLEPLAGEGGTEREAALEPSASGALAALPPTLPWHGTLALEALSPAWTTVYRIDGQPVCLERRCGAGTVVLISDSVAFGNEALQRQAAPAFLAWVVGASHRLIFDETNHGIAEHPGIMSLARHYRLGGFLAGLIVLAALFIWRSAVSFIPPRSMGAGEETHAAGQDALTGFGNLLSSRFSSRQALQACVEEWERSFTRRRPDAARKAEEARALLQADPGRAAKDPGAVYRQLCQLLNPPR